MWQLAALVGFSFVSSVTPGPNNVLLWASGARFGVRQTVPHIVGTAIGIGAMALGAAAGIAALIGAFPELSVVMRTAGSAYLLYLAWRIARSGSSDPIALARPLGFRAAAAFQLVNPKAWIFALGAVTTFRPADVPIAPGTLLVATVMVVVILPTAWLWAAGGGTLSRLLSEGGRGRANRVLALVVALTVVLVWV